MPTKPGDSGPDVLPALTSESHVGSFRVVARLQDDYALFIAIPLMNLLIPRTFRVTDAGLVVEHPLQRLFRPWSAFTGYELTADALVIRPAAWWRPAHRCDREDIEDVDAGVAAVDEWLPNRR